MYKIRTTHQFEKDLQRCIKRGYPMEKFRKVIQLLERDGTLPAIYRPHLLRGDRRGQWECHIQPDWLLIWKQYDDELELLMLNTGTHSDLFRK
ncbi:MAG: type II toxin-antitoxin system YafQ family toxin [Prevotella sp.]|nr:type II toxin-antitoxin system YafQ family toxin [Prevotella sp.]